MNKRKLYMETYGCQMNISDSQIVSAIMTDHDFEVTENIAEADLIFVNTCSIREHAEQRIRARLREFKRYKKINPELKIGLLGCMAERLKEQLLEQEQIVDIIVGPDAYRDLPRLLYITETGQKAVNVLLSGDETYADINPVHSKGIAAFISIMRGCENFCSYCVVPFTRGTERSRTSATIIQEAQRLFDDGIREVTLLGQNVNSYQSEDGTNFPTLLEQVALVNPLLRVRFATSHPKDISDQLLETIAKHPNICKNIHLPVQSGSNKMLKLMNRKYTREWYMDRIDAIKRIIPGCGITTDIIAGFCAETEEDHQLTMDLMKWAEYDYAYMFKYSERPDTLAAKRYPDDVAEEEKGRRLAEIIDLQHDLSYRSNLRDVGQTFEVLIENVSKKSKEEMSGRNSQNKTIVFPSTNHSPGEYIHVKVTSCNSATLRGEIINIQ